MPDLASRSSAPETWVVHSRKELRWSAPTVSRVIVKGTFGESPGGNGRLASRQSANHSPRHFDPAGRNQDQAQQAGEAQEQPPAQPGRMSLEE